MVVYASCRDVEIERGGKGTVVGTCDEWWCGDVDETTDLRHERGGATVFGGPLHGFASVGDAEGGVLF